MLLDSCLETEAALVAGLFEPPLRKGTGCDSNIDCIFTMMLSLLMKCSQQVLKDQWDILESKWN